MPFRSRLFRPGGVLSALYFSRAIQVIDEDEEEIHYLLALFDLLVGSGFLTYLEHLTISLEQIYTPHWHKYPGEDCFPEDDNVDARFIYDIKQWAGIFGVLHRYKMKAELTISETSETREPIFKRLEQLSKSTLRCDRACLLEGLGKT
jgi:hypothetical protein